jgi:DNA-binding transcriptional regulator LsrR (DeoR family)
MDDRWIPNDNDEEERFQVKVAWLYYVEGLIQGDIARHIGTTRLRVNRALATARQNGIVRISIHSPFAPCLELQERMKSRFSLKDASIAPGPSDDGNAQPVVGVELGNYLSRLLRDPTIRLFGIGWGNTLNYATRSVMPARRPELEIVSVMGGLPKGSDVNSIEITTRVAELFGAGRMYLTAPLYASTEQSRDTIMVQEVFQEVLTKIRRTDAMAMGVGDMTERSLLIRDGLPTDVGVAELEAAGAVGDMLGYFLDIQGRLVDHPINRRVIGIDPYELRGKDNVILAAGGQYKIRAITAALRTGFFDILVTDQRTAEGILAFDQGGDAG